MNDSWRQSFQRRKGPSSIVSVSSNLSALFQKPEETIHSAHLSAEEQKHIHDVLKRDGSLRNLEQQRVCRLRRELSIKKEKLLENRDGNRCKNCNTSLQFLIHPGYPCNQCGFEYCKQCIIMKSDPVYHLCKVCHEESIQRLKTGKWLEIFVSQDQGDGVVDPESWKESLYSYLKEKQAEDLRKEDDIITTSKKKSERKFKKKGKSNSKVEVSNYDHEEYNMLQDQLSNNNLSRSELSLSKIEGKSKMTVRSDEMSGLSQSLTLSKHSKPQDMATYSLHSSATKDEYQTRKSMTMSRASSESKKNSVLAADDDVKSDVSTATGMSKQSCGGSLMSLYSENDESYASNIDISGEILLGMDYEYKKQIFIIFVKECRNLAPVQVRKRRSNPYVKCYLLPDKSKTGKRKTAVKKKTLSPHFNETLTYSISKGDLETRTLFVTVWHYQALGNSIFLGEVLIPMAFRKFGNASPKWYPLQEKKEISVPLPVLIYKGDLVLAVMYSTSPGGSHAGEIPGGEIHVFVKEAKNLISNLKSSSVDSYVKAYVLPDRTSLNKRKTEIIRRNNSPFWSTLMCFPGISRHELSERSLEIKVWEASRVGNNSFLGGVRLNLGTGIHRGKPVTWMDSTEAEGDLWKKMMDVPDLWHEVVLPLRSNLI